MRKFFALLAGLTFTAFWVPARAAVEHLIFTEHGALATWNFQEADPDNSACVLQTDINAFASDGISKEGNTKQSFSGGVISIHIFRKCGDTRTDLIFIPAITDLVPTAFVAKGQGARLTIQNLVNQDLVSSQSVIINADITWNKTGRTMVEQFVITDGKVVFVDRTKSMKYEAAARGVVSVVITDFVLTLVSEDDPSSEAFIFKNVADVFFKP